MRILIDARSARTATGRHVLQGLAAAWQRDARVSAVMVGAQADADLTALMPEVERLPLTAGSWLSHVVTDLPRLADRVRADVIFCPNGVGPADPRTVLYFQDMFQFRVRGVANVHLEWLRCKLRDAWRRVSAPRSKLAVGVSREIAGEVARRLPLPVVTIPNGVEVGDMRWTGEDDQVFVLGGTGRRKDEETAVRAWSTLPRDVVASTTLVVGGVEPAPRRDALRRLADSLGAGRAVRITGAMPREAYLELIARSRLAVSCSWLEAFDLPVAEALAIGAPVLCTDIAAHRELVERAGAGATFEPRRPEALAEQLARALCGQPPARLTCVPDGWSWAARAREHIDAYLAHN
ncbi:MAG: glycosyltransferase [Gemmatimonadaceae bacterium]|nr:glycosyltransferase [Gemmatimonadaceae bacterium]